MSVGYSLTKADFDSRAGQLSTAFSADLYNWQQFYNLLTSAAWGTANMMSVLGYTSDEASTMLNAATDIGHSLYNVVHANGTVASSNDFLYNVRPLMGVAGTGT
jgi:hypothetical protein